MKQIPVTEEKLEKSITAMKGWFEEFKDEVYNRLDNVVAQLETIRDEQTLAYGQHKGLEAKVEDHEKRIIALEPAES